MRVYLIRHGQSENNYAEHTDTPRVEDPALTPVGFEQAQSLADYMLTNRDPYPVFEPSATDFSGNFGFTQLYVSPMIRALQTVQPLATAAGIRPQVWIDLHEIGGIWLERGPDEYEGLAGLNRLQIMRDFPGYVVPDSIGDNGWWNCRERETRAECDVRAMLVAQRLQQMAVERPSEVIGLVAHQYFLAVLLRALLLLQDATSVWFQHYNTGVTRLELLENGITVLRYINRVDHLAQNCVTT